MEDISFKAGTEVELESTFEVQQGAVLNIDIEDCMVPADGNPKSEVSNLTNPKG